MFPFFLTTVNIPSYYLASVLYGRSGDSEKAGLLRSEAVDLIGRCFGHDGVQAQYEKDFCKEMYTL